ncbi:MAG: NTP transferase domain-containing protein [Bacteroidales bacterium]|nr:NTP transferase domain-containing protein [Bacteroidales bacterium]MDZ4203617.1 NTP transferase domain-containing protein [Bacteroidales bacterium]
MSSNTTFSVVVLAAGQSQRMGQEKFALEFAGGISFLDHIIAEYKKLGCRSVVVVVNPKGKIDLESITKRWPAEVLVTVNPNPEHGRFLSIKTGLKHLQEDDFVFIQNVDSPSISIEVLSALLNEIGNAEYTHPDYRGKGGHPVLLTKKVVHAILLKKSDNMVLKDFLVKFRKVHTEVDDERVLTNINTLDEYKRWKQLSNNPSDRFKSV